jgi:glucuronate isomerase
MACFHSLGCRASDHGLTEVPFVRDAAERAPGIFLKAMAGDTLDRCETEAYQTALLLFLGEAYHQRGWVMQLHYGVRRNANSALYMALGPDVGLDCIRGPGCGRHLADLLDAMGGSLPKTIVYSLDPNDDALLDTVCGCFTKPGKAGWVQHGSAWWYNDTKQGIQAQLTGLAARGLLGGFIGMLTDSRSFLSYTRHEYFRRLLCSLLGGWVESGEYPDDPETLGGMVRDISYHNVKRYFNL